MQIPFLKKKNQGGGGPPIEETRESDQSSNEALLEHIGSEILEAINSRDIKSLRAALEALCHMIREQDEEQDATADVG